MQDLNRALAYVEENLAGEIDYAEVGRRARCSEDHFARTFSFLAGMGLSDYVRRRRLTLAATDLRHMRVIDVAVKYGYQSAESFARAFKAQHGVAPSQARQATLRSFSRVSFQLTIQGATDMDYRLIEKPAFRLVGQKKRVSLIYAGINPEIAAQWHALSPELRERIEALSDQEPSGLISGVAHFSECTAEHSQLDHYIAAATGAACPEGMDGLEVPAGTWAVFESTGPFPETMQNTWARIFSEWFPSSGYQLAPGPELVWTPDRDVSRPDYTCQIWVPVRPNPRP